ncbi:MAG: response regulator transcription factor [Rhodobacteraceae bacterium]|jgi:DNA-binding response OmpR family regulator|nr:response regulator transcription factor [Paracoccaceae bacterium]
MIDDDTELAEVLKPVLKEYGIDLASAESPDEGFAMLRDEVPDVVLLDMMLPGMDGLSVCHAIRLSEGPVRDVPIVVLSARAGLTDRVVGLESGVDDYIAKPVEPRELVARLRAVSRSLSPAVPSAGRAAAAITPPAPQVLDLDEARLEATFAGVRVQLTDLEMQVLVALKSAGGAVLSRAEILDRIRHSPQSDPTGIDTVIFRVRQKFRNGGVTGDFIETVRGAGYSIREGGSR